ncbi:MAG: DNA-3-methyladenine glycosylase I [Propionibacteriaceae bacterium]|nr:DNA-3-methyladenine glycosylase I [Propionibacteriaceae bacterium]
MRSSPPDPTSIPDLTIAPERRCFGGDSALYQAYHDWEWGQPVHGDTEWFERLSLEGFSSGLSWLTVLRKRDSLRQAFAGFDPARVAAFGQNDVERLLGDPGVIRSRAKITGAIGNARVLLDYQAHGGSLDELVWGHRPAQHHPPARAEEHPAQSPESEALASQLRRLGFRWLGPVNVYAAMEACGVINNHLPDCPRSQS